MRWASSGYFTTAYHRMREGFPVPSRMPSDAEIRAAGERLGHGPGPYPTKLRAQLAKTIQLGETMEAQERQDESVSASFASRLAQIAADLRRHNFSATGAEEIAAAVAPTVYRESQKKDPTA